MSSKDLEAIGSSDEDWGESMDVGETPQTAMEVPAQTGMEIGAPQAASPSVDMAESSGEVEMKEANEDAEMKDLSAEPEDLGELKSPSPTVEMKSPSVPVEEMKESEENELLKSPAGQGDNELGESSLIEESDILEPEKIESENLVVEPEIPLLLEPQDDVESENLVVEPEIPLLLEPQDDVESENLVVEPEIPLLLEPQDDVESENLVVEPEIPLLLEPQDDEDSEEPETPTVSEPLTETVSKPITETVPEPSTESDIDTLSETPVPIICEPQVENLPEVTTSEETDSTTNQIAEVAEPEILEPKSTEEQEPECDSSDIIEPTETESDPKSGEVCEPDVEEPDVSETPQVQAETVEISEDKSESEKDDLKSTEKSEKIETENIKESETVDEIKETGEVSEINDKKESPSEPLESSKEPDESAEQASPVASETVDADKPESEPKDVSSEDLEKSNDVDMKEVDTLKDADDSKDAPEHDKTDDDSRTQLSFDDTSQMSGKEVNVDNMEDVTVPGGADAHVNDEEDSVDDPLNDKSGSVNPLEAADKDEISILPDASKPDKDNDTLPAEGDETLPPGSAEGDEILPDSKKKSSDKSTEDAPSSSSDKQEIEVMEIDDDEKSEKSKSEDCNKEAEKLTEPVEETCVQCNEKKQCNFKTSKDDETKFLCDEQCHDKFSKGEETPKETPRLSIAKHAMEEPVEVEVETPSAPFDLEEALKRKCSQCHNECGLNDNSLNWETMDFCNDFCLGAYQKELGSFCANCRGAVNTASMGKYCVRFGFNVRQFCSSSCLEEYKKGLKVCSYCQKDISVDGDGFLAPIGDKGQFKDFCSQQCMQDLDIISSGKFHPGEQAICSVCTELKDVKAEVLLVGGNTNKLCSQPCLAAFKFANNVHTELCIMCKKHFDLSRRESQTVYFNDVRTHFCSKICLNVNSLANRKIVACNWCKVKKYNFDMIRKNQQGQVVMLCSVNCLALFQVSNEAAAGSKLITCNNCNKRAQGMYHLTMSDATVRNFCCYQCCLQFQAQFNSTPIMTPTPTGGPTRYTEPEVASGTSSGQQQMPVITSVTSLAPTPPAPAPAPAPPEVQIKVVQQVFVKPAPVKEMVNKTTQCRPNTSTKGVSCKPIYSSKGSQTEEAAPQKILIPVPVPIYVPMPMHMFSAPVPVPVPFPIPIPVPIFIPTTRNTARGIRKEIRRIQEQIPRDPFEAELLMMAEMVAEDKTGTVTSSDSEDDNDNGGIPSPVEAEPLGGGADSPANSGGEVEEAEYPADTTPPFNDAMLQMALNIASEMQETNNTPSMDMEVAIPVMPTPQAPPPQMHQVSEDEDVKLPVEPRVAKKRGRTRGSTDWAPPNVQKRARTNSQEAVAANQQVRSNGSPPAEPQDPVVEPDPSVSLKYTYGVLAFRKWVRQKNAELTVKSGRSAKLLKTDILQLSTDELNFALCMFVKEVRKPDGEEYAPDIIYYLCLGIQLYLYKSHRIDNIFTDAYYEKFTESLNDITHKFVSRINDRSEYPLLEKNNKALPQGKQVPWRGEILKAHQFRKKKFLFLNCAFKISPRHGSRYPLSCALVTRVEEEHLWESQQLGAHSPHVLLFTLMFFNTKHFLLTEAEDHMRLSFTHVMKHWKRNHAQPGKTGSTRNVLLRYYPPQSVLDADERKKKVYEQQENENNPLRCPVKLYEFYVSKCPESVRGRNDVFYLLPERSCVPDSPVWYSTMALPKENISKMLNRIRMVREVLALLHGLNY